MLRKAIYKDTSLCVECQACRVACQMHNGLRPERVYIELMSVEHGRYPAATSFLARRSCLQCGEPACAELCPTEAIVKGKSGFTYYDAKKCIGCGFCRDVCPYKAARIIAGEAVRCAGCPDLVEANRAPACVETCITNALRFGDRAAMLAEAAKRLALLQKQQPGASIFGRAEHGGLGVIQILRTKPTVFGFPG